MKLKKMVPWIIIIVFVGASFAFIVPYLGFGSSFELEIYYSEKPIKGKVSFQKGQNLLEVLSKYLNIEVYNNSIRCIELPVGASYYNICNNNQSKWNVYVVRGWNMEKVNDLSVFYPKKGDDVIIKYE